jgi:hypothetical protein
MRVTSESTRKSTSWMSTLFGVVGFASAAVGLVQAFSFEHLERVKCSEVEALECLAGIANHKESIILLNWDMLAYDGRANPDMLGYVTLGPFKRKEQGELVAWIFHDLEFVRGLGMSVDDWTRASTHDRVRRIIEQRLSRNGTRLEDTQMPNNGIVLSFVWKAGANPFMIMDNVEGNDVFRGPFQITYISNDLSDHYTLTPAPMTDSLGKQVRCANRDWTPLAKFFLCPFA